MEDGLEKDDDVTTAAAAAASSSTAPRVFNRAVLSQMKQTLSQFIEDVRFPAFPRGEH